MSKQSNSQIRSNQEGIVAIIVAVTLTVIMSLIVLAITQNSNREQRQALDRQLSDQAFYNAESGVNDITNYLYQNIAAATPIPIEKKDCLPQITAIPYTLSDPSGTNKYTCLLYNKAPETVLYDGLSLATPKVVPLQPVNDLGAPIVLKDLTLSWDDATDRNASIACDFTSGLPTDCGYGGLRFEIITPAGNRDAIRQLGLSGFLVPVTSATPDISVSALAYPDNQGILSQTTCNGPAGTRRCSKTITDINRNNLFLSLRSLYRPVNLSISGKDASGNPVRFKDTQTVIDATGKASDVLRRVQVRIPATSQYDLPGFSIQSRDSICKVLNVSKNDDGSGTVDTADPAACPIN